MKQRPFLFSSVALALSFVSFAGYAQPLVTATKLSGLGAAWELEMRTFGKRLQIGDDVESVPFARFSLSLLSSLYAVSGLHGDSIRICRFQESIAVKAEESAHARDCIRTALANQGRYHQAEQIALEDGKWTPPGGRPSAELALMWQWSATMNLNQGNAHLAKIAFDRSAEVARAVSALPPTSNTKPVDQNVQSMRGHTLDGVIRGSKKGLAFLDFYEQDFRNFDRILSERMNEGPATNNLWGIDSIEVAMPAVAAFRPVPTGLFQRALSDLRADAGFRDQLEPLADFRVRESSSAALGDETVQPVHVVAWVRLASAYRGLSRIDEASRLLVAANELARRYKVEPLESNTLLARVEEAQAQLAADAGDWPEVVRLLRAARGRLVAATVVERSTEAGRRGTPIGSPLLGVNAKLLGALYRTHQGRFTEPPEMDEILLLIQDFSASRADLNSQLAARAKAPVSAAEGHLLDREGRLIDELVELKAVLSAGRDSGAVRDVAVNRIVVIYKQLGEIKVELGEGSARKHGESAAQFRQQLGDGALFFQWVFHPFGNFRVIVGSDAIALEPINAPLAKIRASVALLHENAALRSVTSFEQIKPYAHGVAGELYSDLFGSRVFDGKKWVLGNSRYLDGLPWPALKTRQGRWLIEDRVLVVAPSWLSWLRLEERGASRAPKNLLAIGDPENGAAPLILKDIGKRGAYVSSAVDKDVIQPVRFKSEFSIEIDTLASMYAPESVKTLKGPAATKARLLSHELQDYKVLVFSTHGFVAGAVTLALGPGLEMTATKDGGPSSRLLVASEVARLKLDADVVVLSACDTSSSDGVDGSEGYSGLASAFLLAGSRSVMSTLWPVETKATRELITGTVRAARGHQVDYARALRASVLEYLRRAPAIQRHPYFWAGIGVIGR